MTSVKFLESDKKMSMRELAKVAWNLCREAQNFAGDGAGDIEILNCTTGGLVKVAEEGKGEV